MADTFTPEQIAQILEEFFKTVGTRQYIGARYVPIFGRKDEESIIWDNSAPYEPLTIVLYQGNSYTSRQYVPEGVEITNEEFWANTGNYNAQVEQYRRETAHALEVANTAQESAENAQDDIDKLLPKSSFTSENTVKDYIDSAIQAVQDDVQEVQNDIDTLLPKTAFSAENTVEAQLNSIKNVINENVPYELTSKYISSIDAYVHMITIPMDKSDLPYLGINGIDYQYACEYAYNKSNAFLINGSLGTPRISKGFIDGESRGQTPQGWYIMGFDANGTPKITPDVSFQATAANLIAQGYVTAFPVWSPIVLNNQVYDYESEIPSTDDDYDYIFNKKHPRSVFGWDDGNYYLIACEGRIPYSTGLDFAELVEMCRILNIPNAMNMDGGGSTQLWCTNPATNLVYSRDVTVSQSPNVPYNSRNVQALMVFDFKE